MSLAAQELPVARAAIFAPSEADPAQVQALRASGECVICALPGQAGGASEMGCERELRKVGAEWVVVGVSVDKMSGVLA